MLGGTGLFLAGHAAFKATVWRRGPWLRLGAVAVLAALGALASSVSALALGAAATAVVLLLVVSDRLPVREAPIRV